MDSFLDLIWEYKWYLVFIAYIMALASFIYYVDKEVKKEKQEK